MSISELPIPDFEIVESMCTRRSTRRFSGDYLTPEEVSQVLWAAYGVNNFRRTVPSAGAIYPLSIYYVWHYGLWKYLPKGHLREMINGKYDKTPLCDACIGQKFIMDAHLVIIVAADCSKTRRKYRGRGKRYIALEAGHVGQNVHLMCEALGLGCVMIGAFSDRKVKFALGIDEDPLYVIPIGRING